MSPTPEDLARQTIDGPLEQTGWIVQYRVDADIDAGPGVAIREFSLGHGFGEAEHPSQCPMAQDKLAKCPSARQFSVCFARGTTAKGS